MWLLWQGVHSQGLLEQTFNNSHGWENIIFSNENSDKSVNQTQFQFQPTKSVSQPTNQSYFKQKNIKFNSNQNSKTIIIKMQNFFYQALINFILWKKKKYLISNYFSPILVVLSMFLNFFTTKYNWSKFYIFIKLTLTNSGSKISI